ncbi:MAG: InlB B-repeat-containing protein [Lacibacter sp.]
MKQNVTRLFAAMRLLAASFVLFIAAAGVVQAQQVTLPLNYSFNTAPLPPGLTSNGTLNTGGAIGSCTFCTAGRLEVPLSGFLQIDAPSLSVLHVNMKSSASTARTVTIRYRKGSTGDYTTAGTVSVPQAGTAFQLATQFPELVSAGEISVRIENAATGGQFHIHDIQMEGGGAASSAAEITAFKLPGQVGNEIINSAQGRVELTVANGTSLVNVVPSVVSLSPGATISPAANTPRDFSGGAGVTYTVTAENGTTTKNWTVQVTTQPPAALTDYEAEEAEFTGTVDNNHTGFTGTGFVNFLSTGENFIVFNVCQTTAGERTAVFRYALGVVQDRKGSLFVNDQFIQLLDFAPTGAWTNWADETVTLNLLAGINQIKITWDSTDGPNLDKLQLSGTPCTRYTLTVQTTNGGTVTLSPTRFANRYFEGETLTLLANARADLNFNNWSGDLTGTTNPATMVMNANKTVTAHFTVVPTFTLQVTTVGIGQVTLNPAGGVYPQGTTVTLTASPVMGTTFQGWSGALSGSANPATLVMDGNKTVTATFGGNAGIDFNTPVGFAAANTGNTYPEFNSAVTGGQNATDTFWVRGPADFDTLAWHLYYRNRAYRIGTPQNGVPKAPLVIVIKEGLYPEGTSSSQAWGNGMMTIQEQGDLTIIGERNVVLRWGFNIKRSWNILIRNITFQDYRDDGINITDPETHHIWIDHCTLGHPTTLPANQDSPDGGVDVKQGSSYVTVSWCLFRNSWKTSLVGHSDNNAAQDVGRLKVTYFANHFLNTNSRHPRVRFGEVHVLNNLYERVSLYGIAAANQARVVAEGNFFLNTRWGMYADRTVADFRAVFGNNTDNVFTSKTGNIPAAYLRQFNNAYDDSGLPVITAQINPAMLNPGGRSVRFDELNPSAAFNPRTYYDYNAFDAATVRTIVPLFAGADKVDFFAINSSTPSITASGTLTPFNQVVGMPSAVQSYTVAAANLTGNLTITPPAAFEISGDGGNTWFTNTNPLVIVPVGGSVAPQTIQVRLNAATTGSYSGSLVHTASGAATVNVAVNGVTSQPPANTKLIYWPLQANDQDDAAERNVGVAASVPRLNNLYLSNGTEVPTVPAFSELHGMAFGADAGGRGLWGTGTGGPGGTLRRNFYIEFPVVARAGYRVKIDSIVLNAAFHNTSSGTNLGIAYSKSAFVNDSSNISGGGEALGVPINPPAGAFTSPIPLQNRTTVGSPDNYRLAINGAAGVVLEPGETLYVRLYFSCSSTSAGRYGKLKDLFFVGSSESTIPQPVINVNATLTSFAQTIGAPSAEQTYTVSASNLTEDLTLTPPAGYEISADGGTTWFGNATPLVLTPVSGSINATTISVRLNAATAGAYSGAITHASAGANPVDLLVSGSAVNPPVLIITASLTNFAQVVGTPSAVQTYQVAGTDLTGPVTITPPVEYQVSADAGATWFNNANPLVLNPASGALSATISVRLNAAAPGTYSGAITHATNGLPVQNVPVSGITSDVPQPIITVSAAFTPFAQTLGAPSTAQTYTVSGSDLVAPITITAPANYQLSANGGAIWSSAPLQLNPVAGTVAATTISVRLNATAAGTYSGTLSHSSTDAVTVTLPVTGTAVNPPVITLSGSLTAFSQVMGAPSAVQTYTVAATDLTAALLITPPAGYQVSADGGTTWFGNTTPLSIIPVAGTITTTTISVRLNAATAGTYAGTIAHTSTGAATVQLPVSGTAVNPPVLNITGTLNAFSQTIGSPSAAQNYTVSGANLTGAVTITPPANFEVSANGGATWFGNANPLVLTPAAGTLNATTISVRLHATTAGTYSGTIQHATPGTTAATVAVSGTAVNPPTVTISRTLQPFSQTLGTPSGVQLFQVQGAFLVGPITITPPAGYEVSVNNVAWFDASNPLVLTPASGTVAATLIRVRLNNTALGASGGNIAVQTNGVPLQNVTVSGFTYPLMKLAPNPASNQVTVYHPFLFQTGEITVRDASGATVIRQRTTAASNSTVLDIRRLQAGIYTLDMWMGNERFQFRFVKQ